MLRFLAASALTVLLTAFAGDTEPPKIPEANWYAMKGVYHQTGICIDRTGEAWGYDAEIGEGTPIIIYFGDNGTPDRLDDEVLSVEIR